MVARMTALNHAPKSSTRFGCFQTVFGHRPVLKHNLINSAVRAAFKKESHRASFSPDIRMLEACSYGRNSFGPPTHSYSVVPRKLRHSCSIVTLIVRLNALNLLAGVKVYTFQGRCITGVLTVLVRRHQKRFITRVYHRVIAAKQALMRPEQSLAVVAI